MVFAFARQGSCQTRVSFVGSVEAQLHFQLNSVSLRSSLNLCSTSNNAGASRSRTMSGLLSRALRSPSSSSLQQYASVQSLVSDLDAEAQQDELELSSGGDDSVHSVNGGNLIQGSDSQSHSVDDETLLFGFEESGAELNAVASAQRGHR